jgi:hypothetical protein
MIILHAVMVEVLLIKESFEKQEETAERRWIGMVNLNLILVMMKKKKRSMWRG